MGHGLKLRMWRGDAFGGGLTDYTVNVEEGPEGIKITDNAIIPMKERVVDRKYDPVVWLGSKVFKRSDRASREEV